MAFFFKFYRKILINLVFRLSMFAMTLNCIFYLDLTTGFVKPSAHSMIFVAEDEDFCRWRGKLAVYGKHI